MRKKLSWEKIAEQVVNVAIHVVLDKGEPLEAGKRGVRSMQRTRKSINTIARRALHAALVQRGIGQRAVAQHKRARASQPSAPVRRDGAVAEAARGHRDHQIVPRKHGPARTRREARHTA